LWLWSIGRAVVLPVYRLLFRIKVEGLENIPRTGGIILCSNHIRAHDPPLLGMLAPRPVRFMAKEELFKVPVVGWFVLHGGGAFPVKRGTADRGALKQSLGVLAQGGCFGIFPEGTRSTTGKMSKLEPGTAYLALKSGATVIPVAFSGTYALFSRLLIRFGKPIDLSAFSGHKLTSETLETAGEVISQGIARQIDLTLFQP
jgi:1-acyl-sn-glycerol-3-phosphate acyltransferase